MKQYLRHDEWRILEDSWHPEENRVSESVFSIGNGHMGQRANFEESFSGDTLPGSYLGGIYYPDKTRVGWWKIGYPESFAKVLNAPNWIGISVSIDGEPVDLGKDEVEEFSRELNMREGYLARTATVKLRQGGRVRIESLRFCSLARPEVGAIRYAVTPLDFSGTLNLTPYINADVVNEDANYEERFWTEVHTRVKKRSAFVLSETKKTQFQVCTGMKFSLWRGEEEIPIVSHRMQREKFVGCSVDLEAREGEEVVLYKFATNVTSRDYEPEELVKTAKQRVKEAFNAGFDELRREQAAAWAAKWAEADIRIEGDVAAQQAIRFNIFQLYQTYTGQDPRLNIGPKGFTGEKYGGGTYWDTEAFCFPFYLATAEPAVARNLLLYRYRFLPEAIENAARLGFTGGAALYPMVTMDGTESHNEWEITFEEIHRNGAIAYAIYDYIRYTGDSDYLVEHGLEVLIGIARYWARRVHWAPRKSAFVIHGVTGPNEYENNVNNNWYTNYIARWCLAFCLEALEYVRKKDEEALQVLIEQTGFDLESETKLWWQIIEQLYLPHDEELGIFVQHDGFLDKELKTVADLDPAERPLNQHWSWDRILRSVYIKQADVLQGIYFFENHFDEDIRRRNFDFYEPRTVHESSLSAAVHAVMAASLGYTDRAYDFYLRTARLDLDNYNNDTADGCHITSMAGSWLALVKGFGGLRVHGGRLHLHPVVPQAWESFTFTIRFRGHVLDVHVGKEQVTLRNQGDEVLKVVLFGKEVTVSPKRQKVQKVKG